MTYRTLSSRDLFLVGFVWSCAAGCSLQDFDYLKKGGGTGGDGVGGLGTHEAGTGDEGTGGAATGETGGGTSVEDASSESSELADTGADATGRSDGGPSVLVNPSFEAGLSGWTIDPPTAMTKYVYTQFAQGGSMTIDGQNELATWSPTDAFTVRIFQTPMNLPSGTYTFSAYFNRGDGFNAAYMYARNCGGTDQQLTIPVTSATQWVKSQITVQVTAGQCEVGIYEESNPTDWLNADALSFAEDPQ